MQTPNLELSNIALKQPHYMAESVSHNFNFELEPITHKSKLGNDLEQRMLLRQKQFQLRKQLLENSQNIRREILLQKIEAKNERFELKKKYEKENIKSPDIPCLNRQKNNKLYIENVRSSQKSKLQGGEAHKIYGNSIKVPISPKGFFRNTGSFERMRKTHNLTNDDGVFKEIKLRAVKLPELNSVSPKVNTEKFPAQIIIGDQQIEGSQKRKLTKVKDEETMNPLLKIHDTRYFGVEERNEDWEKTGKALLKEIRKKYWCYDSLDTNEVYENFEQICCWSIDSI